MSCEWDKVNELPKFLDDSPTDKTHTIVAYDPLDPTSPLIIPLQLRGVTSYFDVRKPSIDEYEQGDLPHIVMTAEGPVWEPSESDFAEQAAAMTDFRGHIIDRESLARGRRIISFMTHTITNHTSIDVDTIDFTDNDNFGDALQSKVQVPRVGVSKGKRSIPAEALAQKWMISPEAANRTVQCTTQRGIRTVLHPSLSRRFRTNDRALRYKRLQHNVFTDTLKAGTKFRRGNLYAQVYATPFHWCRAHPMKEKSEAHETLSLVFQRDGVPPKMIMDGAKEQVQGQFRTY